MAQETSASNLYAALLEHKAWGAAVIASCSTRSDACGERYTDRLCLAWQLKEAEKE